MFVSATVLVVCLLGNGNPEQILQSGGGSQINVSTQTNPQQNGVAESPSVSTESQLESAIGNTPHGENFYEPVFFGGYYGQSTTPTASQADFQVLTGQSVGQTHSEDIGNNSHYENFGHNVIRPSQYRQWTNHTLTPQRPQGYLGVNSASYSAGGKPLSSFGVEDYPSSRIGLYPHLRSQPDSSGLENRDGTTDSNGKQESTVRINEGQAAKNDNNLLPWQASVFGKDSSRMPRICGGSMVSRSAVISAVFCFWGGDKINGVLPASTFVVGAGEVPPGRWGDYNSYRHRSDVDAIKVPPSYGGYGSGALDRSGIAVLLLSRPFVDNTGIRPVCISFDRGLEEHQFKAGNVATTLGANSYTKERTDLQILWVPYIPVGECKAALGRDSYWISEHKICAGLKSLSPSLPNLCSQDIGAGLVFYNHDRAKGMAAPFLRGVASFPPSCGEVKVKPTLYARVSAYRSFLEEHLGDVEKECRKYYPQLGASMGIMDKAKETRDTEFVCNCFC